MNSDGLSMGYKNVQPSTHHPSCCLQHHMPGQESLYKTANNWIPLKFREKKIQIHANPLGNRHVRSFPPCPPMSHQKCQPSWTHRFMLYPSINRPQLGEALTPCRPQGSPTCWIHRPPCRWTCLPSGCLQLVVFTTPVKGPTQKFVRKKARQVLKRIGFVWK